LLASKTHSVEGREVVRLFIDMHDLWKNLAHNLAEARIVVEVKVAVEGHGRDDDTIACRVARFKDLLAAIVSIPIGGCHQRKFDPRTFRQFFKLALRGTRDEGF